MNEENYTATMKYTFKDESFEDGCTLWKNTVLKEAEGRNGLIRMQWLESKPNAMAIGTWTDKTYANEFMQTGVFKRLMDQIEGYLVTKPTPEIWNLSAYYQQDKH